MHGWVRKEGRTAVQSSIASWPLAESVPPYYQLPSSAAMPLYEAPVSPFTHAVTVTSAIVRYNYGRSPIASIDWRKSSKGHKSDCVFSNVTDINNIGYKVLHIDSFSSALEPRRASEAPDQPRQLRPGPHATVSYTHLTLPTKA